MALVPLPVPSVARPLTFFTGEWAGSGLNAIWRPNDRLASDTPGVSNPDVTDRFLALNLTNETISFTPLGLVPNRGMNDPDIFMPAVQYIQQIKDANFGTSTLVAVESAPSATPSIPVSNGGVMHQEPGVWIALPPAQADAQHATVNRLGSIPHGVTIFLEGTARQVILSTAGAPHTPAFFGPPASIRPTGGAFPEQNLLASHPTTRTFPLPVGTGDYSGTAPQISGDSSVQQTTPLNVMLDIGNLEGTTSYPVVGPLQGTITASIMLNLNQVLANQNLLLTNQGFALTSALSLSVTSQLPGTFENMDMLGTLTAQKSAQVALSTATFWLENWLNSSTGNVLQQIQYTQTVMLKFNGLTWPHVTVGTLTRVS